MVKLCYNKPVGKPTEPTKPTNPPTDTTNGAWFYIDLRQNYRVKLRPTIWMSSG